MPSVTPYQPNNNEFSGLSEGKTAYEISQLKNLSVSQEENIDITVATAKGDQVSLSSDSVKEDTYTTYNVSSLIDDVPDSKEKVEEKIDYSAFEFTGFETAYSGDKDIIIVTKEGDKVTLSTNQLFESAYTSYDSYVQSDTASISLKEESFSIEFSQDLFAMVEGEISKQEFKDIRKAIKLIDRAINKFISGDIEHAVAKTLKAGNLGTISNFEASLEIEQRLSQDNFITANGSSWFQSSNDTLLKVNTATLAFSGSDVDDTEEQNIPLAGSVEEITPESETTATAQNDSLINTIEGQDVSTLAQAEDLPTNENQKLDSTTPESAKNTNTNLESTPVIEPDKEEAEPEKISTPKPAILDENESNKESLLRDRINNLTKKLINIMEKSESRISVFQRFLDKYFQHLNDRYSIEKHSDSPIPKFVRQIQTDLVDKMTHIK